ncbi:MAG: metallophosphoesterase [Gemmatimonas sp.]
MTPPPAAAPAAIVAQSGASVMIGAGDIHSCTSQIGSSTAALVDSVLRADSTAKVNDAVFLLGDNATAGGPTQYADCFTRTWGDLGKRSGKKLHPTPGNHEYDTGNADQYFKYFGAAAGSPGKGFYSYDVGEWHVIVVNSNMIVSNDFPEAARAEQMRWLEDDLKAHKTPCTIAYWHQPRFSSGWHGSNAQLGPLWQLLYDHNVELVLSGHDHGYERFQPMSPAGVRDTVKGITAIVAGTGGGTLRGFSKILPNSAYRIEGRHGVLLLTLGKAEYRSAFLEVGGRVWDMSGGKCH